MGRFHWQRTWRLPDLVRSLLYLRLYVQTSEITFFTGQVQLNRFLAIRVRCIKDTIPSKTPAQHTPTQSRMELVVKNGPQGKGKSSLSFHRGVIHKTFPSACQLAVPQSATSDAQLPPVPCRTAPTQLAKTIPTYAKTFFKINFHDKCR